MRVSAYVPCYNNAATIRRAVESVLAQSVRPDEVLVVDDGSTDDSTARLAGLPVRVVRHSSNLGRGAARARAMEEARGDFVLSVDARGTLPSTYLETGLPWFDDARVAAVFARVAQEAQPGVAGRWRERHLFKTGQDMETHRRAVLSTTSAIVRATTSRAVGGYSPSLRRVEDRDLGERLLAAGYDVIYDPRLTVIAIGRDTVRSVLERYWRWNVAEKTISFTSYLRSVIYSFKVMARADLARGDLASSAVSLACPHYCLARSALAPGMKGPHT